MNAKEKLFCFYFAECGNAERAANKAGFLNPQKASAGLLIRKDIQTAIEERFRQREKMAKQQSLSGYEKLAFGDVSDAVRLIFSNEPSEEQLREYDLFNVAEIKRPKEGAMEIKFFDRLKALERLEMAGMSENRSESDFYKAVIGGIKQAEECQEEIERDDS
ncbi:MAG: terminase small subunit [Clostridia bacterium]|nr:terminase small subunit [Clostridia bacterium]